MYRTFRNVLWQLDGDSPSIDFDNKPMHFRQVSENRHSVSESPDRADTGLLWKSSIPQIQIPHQCIGCPVFRLPNYTYRRSTSLQEQTVEYTESHFHPRNNFVDNPKRQKEHTCSDRPPTANIVSSSLFWISQQPIGVRFHLP
ncbi:hypothetical protein D3C72_1675310 [compost metagenome]